MKTPHSHPDEFFAALKKLGFTPNRWDTAKCRHLDLLKNDRHLVMRVVVDYEGEPAPHSLSLTKHNGQPNQLIEWESLNMSASMPSDGLLALLKESLA